MSYSAMGIAQYVINYSIINGKPVSNLKLQKLMYYIQAAFLVEKNKPCFEEEILRWRHGPVIRKIYSEYKKNFDENIREIQQGYTELFLDSKMDLSIRKVDYNIENYSKNDIEILNRVIDSYTLVSPWEMVERTHAEKPWLETGENQVITNEIILNFFSENINRIYGGQ